ncbi:MAG: hypothetical protein C4K58_01840 [Flavobacteriaceae bacterium]|nr:MAG: hypothetical protein C4K58_01840 [Flavobacteriaceae bacterium]
MHPQIQLESLLVHKGIGEKGSKHFTQEQCETLLPLLLSSETSIITKACLLASTLILEQNSFEKTLIETLEERILDLDPKLHFLFQDKNDETEILLGTSLEKFCQKLIRKEDLSPKEAQIAMDLYFEKDAPDYLKATFLQLERLKRETLEENRTFLESFFDRSERISSPFNFVLDFCNPYDGWNRKPNYSLYTALLLSLCKIPTSIHGVEKIGPKNGLTVFSLLQNMGQNPLKSLQELKTEIQSKQSYFGYLDQSVFFPALYKDKQMRKEMVKRSFIATFEKLLQPIQGKEGNYVLTGYTHSHYKLELARILQGKVAGALIIKGDEGSPQLPLSKKSQYTFVNPKGEILESEVSPEDFGFEFQSEYLEKTQEITAEFQRKLLLESFEKNDSYTQNCIMYNALFYAQTFGFSLTKEDLLAQYPNLKSFVV